MAAGMFSSTLSKFEQEIENVNLLTTLKELSGLHKEDLIILSWNKDYIGVPLNISIELPPNGNYNDIDIRPIEPVVVVFNLKSYPRIAPKVYSDRYDFPKDKLAHLYVAINGKPPALCLVRGDINEWYSNKQIKDLIIRTENWFRDAATGELIQDGNQFDPLRLEGYYGTIIYDYDQLYEIVSKNKSFHSGGNFTIGLFIMQPQFDNDKGLAFKLEEIVTIENVKDLFTKLRKEDEKKSLDKNIYQIGYITWSEAGQVYPDYLLDFPRNWPSFKLYCSNYGIELASIEESIVNYGFRVTPIICGIKRPKSIIGFSGDIEFINFTLINSKEIIDGKISDEATIIFQAHNQPLTLKKAAEISGLPFSVQPPRSFVIGCGALGSKIVMHLARSGWTNFLLSDPDRLSPHNLVRHALYADSEGMNKAQALTKEIEKIYPSDKLDIYPLASPGEYGLQESLINQYDFIMDFSASNSFFHSLIASQTNQKTKICKAYLSDYGNLGILLIEGENRNPRIDDLQIFLYLQSRTTPFIASWLSREFGVDHTVHLTIGVGCNSETVILSDDVVSLHSSLFSGMIKDQLETTKKNGEIYLNQIYNTPYFHNSTKEIMMSQVTILQAENDPSWQIRFFPGIIEKMKSEMQKANAIETGGVFLGTANFKTKTIHIVELIDAPNDSEANEVCFFRGINGLSKNVEEISSVSGGQLGYIGEWHSHPYGPEGMSCIDNQTVKRFKKEFNDLSSPLPVFLAIITPNRVIPYVY